MPSGSGVIDRAAAKAEAKKKELPKGVITAEELGVPYYPGADLSLAQSREYDEGGNHIQEVTLSTRDDVEKFRDFYEKALNAKAMPTVKPCYSIQNDANGKHYQVDYMEQEGDKTIDIKVYTPQQE